MIDNSGFDIRIKSSDKATFILSKKKLEDLKVSYIEDGFDGVLLIPAIKDLQKEEYNLKYFSENQMSITTKEFIERRVANRIRELKIDESAH